MSYFESGTVRKGKLEAGGQQRDVKRRKDQKAAEEGQVVWSRAEGWEVTP